MAVVFFSYSHRDEDLRDLLEVHLSMLKREGAIDVWHDRRIGAGNDLDKAISESLQTADVILLLISPDFLASNYCYDSEMIRAMERHESGEAKVIPVILRHCDWHHAPFGKLRATPTDGKPIKKWTDLDEAFLDVVRDIRQAVQELGASKHIQDTPTIHMSEVVEVETRPRSSNLGVKKTFSEIDKDRYMDDAFEYMAKFFENSLSELKKRNQGLEVKFKGTDAQKFTCVIYREGAAVSRCKIAHGPHHFGGNGITYSYADTPDDSAINDSLSIAEDDHALFLQPLFGGFHGKDGAKLTLQGAAEYYWEKFIEPLQR